MSLEGGAVHRRNGAYGTAALTAAERRVLQASARGLPTDEVAAHLGLSPDEVRRHVAAAMVALGARSKLEAVVLAIRRGLIDLPVG